MKQLEYHPLANAYPLMQGEVYEAFKASIQEAGKIRVAIVLYEGKILDGRNRYRAGTELKIEVPTREYDAASDGDDPEHFVENMNDDRRHEEQEIIRKRRLARVERIAERRRAGESIRAIAAEEKISAAQVRRDIQEASTVPGGGTVETDPSEVENSNANGTTVQPEDGKVTGRDGRTRTANPKQKKTGKKAEAKKEESKPEVEPEPLVDAIGLPVPEKLRDIFSVRSLFDEARKIHKQLTTKINDIALIDAVSAGHFRKELSRREREGKPYFRSTELESVKLLLDDWIPYVACCPWCLRENDGRPQKSCKACYGQNWIPHRLWKQCSQEDRERVEGLVKECV